MIIFELSCPQGHKFEGWFQDRSAFEVQRAERRIVCPICDADTVEIAPTAAAYISRQGCEKKPAPELSPREALIRLRHVVEKHCEDVGADFAEVALKMHAGEAESRNIRGTTTAEDETMLREEGVPFLKIPAPTLDS